MIAPKAFAPILKYIERVYVMTTDKKNGQTKSPRFPISSWNIHQRVLDGLPATNNPVESWHSALTVNILCYKYV